jgi:hypothetical protein
MKLLYCKECHDIFSLSLELKSCTCGKSKGKYTDNFNARYSGPCIPLGIDNNSFRLALNNQPNSGQGFDFEAFVIPKVCNTFIKEKLNENSL